MSRSSVSQINVHQARKIITVPEVPKITWRRRAEGAQQRKIKTWPPKKGKNKNKKNKKQLQMSEPKLNGRLKKKRHDFNVKERKQSNANKKRKSAEIKRRKSVKSRILCSLDWLSSSLKTQDRLRLPERSSSVTRLSIFKIAMLSLMNKTKEVLMVKDLKMFLPPIVLKYSILGKLFLWLTKYRTV